MNVEMRIMEETDTYELVPTEEEQNRLSYCWVYKRKLNADGTHLKFKAQIIVKGNKKEEGLVS